MEGGRRRQVGFSVGYLLVGIAFIWAMQATWGTAPQVRARGVPYSELLQLISDDKLAKAEKAKPIEKILLDMLPENPVQEMAGALDGSSPGNGMLAVMFFALIFGVALSMVEESKRATMVSLLETLFDISMIVIGFSSFPGPARFPARGRPEYSRR